MSTADLFRRPGNPRDTQRIVKRMSEGKPVIFQNYNLYTLTTVVKVSLTTSWFLSNSCLGISTHYPRPVQ
uniref:Uncharacterized protein n=1 Tax=Magallana gigas TaxID=29159 RepID=K1QP06_MAGGI